MRDLRPVAFLRRRPALPALLLLALAYGLVMQSLGWAQTSNFALVKSVYERGTPTIDSHRRESRDSSYTDGHYYSVKAPGLSAFTLPLYAGLDAIGAKSASTWMADRARWAGNSRWNTHGDPVGVYGNDLRISRLVRLRLQRQSPLVWFLGLLGTVLPAALLLGLFRWAGDRVAPGYGLLTAVTMGTATLLLPFATQFFGHVLAALLGFAAFALLWRERAGPARRGTLAGAGALAGLAVFTEYPLALTAIGLGLYAITRPWIAGLERVRRGLAFGAGGLAGLTPLLAYNVWAFGDPFHNSYADAIAVPGVSGHDVLGLNGDGLFGITIPDPWQALELLFSARGMLTLTPVVAVAAYGLVLIAREGWRAEARLAGGLVAAYLVYNAGYWTPFGGGSPGPRFLVPALPFLALGLAVAWRRRPALSLVLAIPSALMMVAATITFPLIGDGETSGEWAQRIADGVFQNTPLNAVGVRNGWITILPVLLALAAAVVVAVRASPRPAFAPAQRVPALAALAAWAVAAAAGPALWGRDAAVTGDWRAVALIAAGATVSAGALLAVTRERDPRRSARPVQVEGAGERGSDLPRQPSPRRQPVEHEPAADLAS